MSRCCLAGNARMTGTIPAHLQSRLVSNVAAKSFEREYEEGG